MLRLLDVQQILLHSNNTERIQQAYMNSPENQRRHFESELVKERRELREKTKDLEASGRLKIREEKKHDHRKKNGIEAQDPAPKNLNRGKNTKLL